MATSRDCIEQVDLRRDKPGRDRIIYDRTYYVTAGKTLSDVDLEKGDALPDVTGSDILLSEWVENVVVDPRTKEKRIMPSQLVRCTAEVINAWAD
ncbi:MAG: hypothetical protein IMZ62_08065 [Chloroflexi bacterium]|nr:hypothetical protein [Chloroflexota bacterium]MBE3118780.1 hypothetical protein [Candidatus Atribacteria bacterium]